MSLNYVRLQKIQYSTQLNKHIFEKRRKEVHKVIRQEKRRMEKENIEKLEKYRYNPKDFLGTAKL